MPSLYCIKFGLLCAGLIMVAIVALFALFVAISSLGSKQEKRKMVDQNG